MIIRPDGSDLLLITQPDHAALAGRLMTAWTHHGFPTRATRDRVLMAAALHDCEWEEWDAAPPVSPETGLPYDFMTAPLAHKQGVWPRAVDRLAARDPYVGALVAQHALTVYRRYAHDPDWHAFFADLERRRDDLFSLSTTPPADAGAATDAATDAAEAAPTWPVVDPSQFLQDYVIVGLGDLFSLVYCSGWHDPYLMEDYRAILHGERLEITPDPFDGATVPLEVSARRIPARRYASDADLRATLARAPVERLAGVASGPLPAPNS